MEWAQRRLGAGGSMVSLCCYWEVIGSWELWLNTLLMNVQVKGHLEGEFRLHSLPHPGPRSNGATQLLLPVTFIFIVNLKGSRITLKANLWPCLWARLGYWGRKARLNLVAPCHGLMSWTEMKKRKWAEHQLCHPLLPACRCHVTSSLTLPVPTMMDCVPSNCEPEGPAFHTLLVASLLSQWWQTVWDKHCGRSLKFRLQAQDLPFVMSKGTQIFFFFFKKKPL